MTTSPANATPPANINNGTTVTNGTSDPMKTVTNAPVNSTWTNTAPATSGWSNYSTWNSPMPGTTVPANNATMGNGSYPSNNGNASSTNNGSMNPPSGSTSPVNNSGTASEQPAPVQSLSSTGDYSAYGTSNATLPPSVSMSYNRDYPTYATQNSTWTQYGDWFYSSYVANGRYTQIFYDNRGNGYSLALPVLMTYVPENVVDQAVKRYGTNLYSITGVKTGDGTKEAYLINLIDRGQSRMEYVGDDGAAVSEVWRIDPPVVEPSAIMATTDANAAMNDETTVADDGLKVKSDDEKTVIKDKDGTKIKVKVKSDGTLKVKQKKTDD